MRTFQSIAHALTKGTLQLCVIALALYSFNTAASELDSIAAVVNDTVITHSQLQHEIAALKQQAIAAHAKLPADGILRQQVLENLINEELQLEFAKSMGITITNQQVDSAIQTIASQHQLSVAQLKQILPKQGINFNQYREQIRQQMLISSARQQALSGQISLSNQEIDDLLKQLHKNNAAPPTREQAKQLLFERKFNAAAQKWLQQLRDNAYIQRN